MIQTLIKIIKLLFDAFTGKSQDYTQISIRRSIILLSIPMILEMFMEAIFGVVDIYFVAKLGDKAVAAVGLTETMLSIVYSLAFGVSMAVTAMIARRIGEKNTEAASVVAGQALYFGLGLSFLISLTGLFFSEDLLRLMGADNEVIAIGSGYTKWLLGGNYVIMFLFLINAIFRGAGNAAIAMRVLIISNSLNIVLDPLLIFGYGPIPALGVEGAAIATNIGRGVGVAYQLYILFSAEGVIRVMGRHLKLVPKIIGRLLFVSLGGTGQFIISSASWIFLTRLVAGFGSETLAGYIIAIRVLIFTILPAWGMANAAATLVGQNLGAGKPGRAEKSVWLTSFYCMVFLGLVSVVYFIFAEQVIRIFTDEVIVVANGIECVRFLSVGYIFFAYGMVISNAFNGAGDTVTPTILNFICFWVIQIPIAYFLADILNSPRGIYVAFLVAEGMLAVLSIILFRRGKWKETKI